MGPTTGNTLSYAYIDNRTTKEKCQDDNDRIDRSCADTHKNSDSRKNSSVIHALSKVDAQMKDKLKYVPKGPNLWMENNCSGLWRKPAAKVDGRRNTQDFRDSISTKKGFVAGLLKLPAEQTKGFTITEKLEAFGGAEDVMATMMAEVAESNDCIKARKCRLVPFSDVEDTKTGKGCCPGQTGHHVLPNAMFQRYAPVTRINEEKKTTTTMEAQGLRKCWEDYSERNALTICLEGAGNKDGNGSHGRAHSETEKVAEKFRHSPDMPYKIARTEIASRIATLFGCDPACMIAQLDDKLKGFYSKNDECGSFPDNAMVSPHSGKPHGGPHVPLAMNRTG